MEVEEMTKPIVQSITDEQISEIERFASFGGDYLKVKNSAVTGLIARLRAAEKDAARWRCARDILTISDIECAHYSLVRSGKPPEESESIRADQTIDAVMELQRVQH